MISLSPKLRQIFLDSVTLARFLNALSMERESAEGENMSLTWVNLVMQMNHLCLFNGEDLPKRHLQHKRDISRGQLSSGSGGSIFTLPQGAFILLIMCVLLRGSRKSCQETHFVSAFIIISAVQATQNKWLAFPEITIDSAADFTRPINSSFLLLSSSLSVHDFVTKLSAVPLLSRVCNWYRINGRFRLFPRERKKEQKKWLLKASPSPTRKHSWANPCVCIRRR